MSTENKVFTDNVRPEDSVSLSDLKNDGNEVHYAQERDEETVASTITGRSVTKSVAKREAVQQEEETAEYVADASHPVEDNEYADEEESEIESDYMNEEEKSTLSMSATPTSNDELKEMTDVKVDADPEKIIGFDNDCVYIVDIDTGKRDAWNRDIYEKKNHVNFDNYME